ncbi:MULTISPECIES: flavin reductase family protein [Streptomyces]|uniref:Flavin reductase like domain-containing protein n=1 Tax=Streptomyces bangladeshensis TaxID=295352 RepID=A0ABP5NTK4_9ACTN|nr:flavin reductase family protein [Streptomyces sp. FBKL.4005]OYP13417.1 hypothetical protein CFC35_02010 [Streptomyces sp. FBKL.4005]
MAADDFRDLMSRFPSGVTVVTARGPGGEPVGMTCSSVASVCTDPPTLLVCLRSDSATLAAVRTGTFGVNMLDRDARDTSELFSARDVDRFSAVSWEPSPAGVPWLPDHSAAMAECRVRATHPVGDHTVVLGEVAHTVTSGRPPLLYGMRRYARWPEGAGPGDEPAVADGPVRKRRTVPPDGVRKRSA